MKRLAVLLVLLASHASAADLSPTPLPGCAEKPLGLAVSADDSMVAAWTKKTLLLWTLPEGELALRSARPGLVAGWELAFSTDGKTLAVFGARKNPIGRDFEVRTYSVADGKLLLAAHVRAPTIAEAWKKAAALPAWRGFDSNLVLPEGFQPLRAPGGRVAVFQAAGAPDIAVSVGGKEAARVKPRGVLRRFALSKDGRLLLTYTREAGLEAYPLSGLDVDGKRP